MNAVLNVCDVCCIFLHTSISICVNIHVELLYTQYKTVYSIYISHKIKWNSKVFFININKHF